MGEGKASCEFCGSEIRESNDYRRVVGWERINRGPTATKGFHAPERQDAYACSTCVGRLQRGVNPGQGSLA